MLFHGPEIFPYLPPGLLTLSSLSKKTLLHLAPITAYCKIYHTPDFLMMGLKVSLHYRLTLFLAYNLPTVKMQFIWG